MSISRIGSSDSIDGLMMDDPPPSPEGNEDRDAVSSVAQAALLAQEEMVENALHDIQQLDSEENRAVLLIQRVCRGYLVRKNLNVKELAPFVRYFDQYAETLRQILEGMEKHVETLWSKEIIGKEKRSKYLMEIEFVVLDYQKIIHEFERVLSKAAYMKTESIMTVSKGQLEELHKKIKDLSVRVGAKDLNTVMNLYFQTDWKQMIYPAALQRLLDINEYFHPVSYLLVDANVSSNNAYPFAEFKGAGSERMSYSFSGEFESGLPIVKKVHFVKQDSFLDTLYGAEIYIPLSEGRRGFVVKGYFDHDRTGIAGTRSYFRKNTLRLQNCMRSLNDVPRAFRRKYLVQYSLRDLLVKTDQDFIGDLRKSYQLYLELKVMKTDKLLQKFYAGNLADQMEILTAYLCSEESKMGYWIFDSIGRVDVGYQRILYDLLHHTMQEEIELTGKELELMREKLSEEGPKDFTLEQRVEMAEMPLEVKRRCLAIIQEAGDAADSPRRPNRLTGEKNQELLWVERLLEYPWGKPKPLLVGPESSRAEMSAWLDRLQKQMDEGVHGHQKAKDHFIELAARLAKTGKGGAVIALVGPPGNGKTTFSREGIAKALDLPFIQLEGKDDLVNLIGTATNYKSAKPGRLFTMFSEAKSKRFVVLIDEFDKFGNTDKAQQCLEKFIQILDPKQNHNLAIDNFFDGVPFDFSEIIWVVTGNDESRFGEILGDRLTIIRTENLKEDEKVEIAKKYSIPSLLKKNGFAEGDVIFSDAILKYIIENYTFEAGARKFEQKLAKIIGRLTIKDLKNPDQPPPYTVDEALVEECLGEPMRPENPVPTEPRIGWVNGLYATSAGIGGTKPVQVQRMYGKEFGHIETTGTVGEMTVESAKVAYAVALNLLSVEKRKELFSGETFGLLIHHGDIGSHADGPSSGSAIVTSIVSQLTGMPVRAQLCMTGEVGPAGHVKPIGGLRAKLTGAKRQGCTLALIPKENEKNLEKLLKELPDLIEPGKFEVKIVSHMDEVLKIALAQ